MNENKLLNKVTPLLKQSSEIIVGPGDDCAVIDFDKDKYFLIAADQLIANIHYDKDNTSVAKIANKLLKRNLSDIAAMGGTPAFATLTIAAKNANEKWYQDFFEAIAESAEKYSVSICGGDISSAPTEDEVCTLTITGWVKKDNLSLRSNANNKDILFVTGELGNSYHSEHHLDFEPRLKEGEFLSSKYTRTMIDISDGLIQDVERIANKSEVSIILDLEKLPLRKGAKIKNALSDGEDYELLFTVPANLADELEKEWKFKTKLTRIGYCDNRNPEKVYDCNQNNLLEKYSGFDHLEDK